MVSLIRYDYLSKDIDPRSYAARMSSPGEGDNAKSLKISVRMTISTLFIVNLGFLQAILVSRAGGLLIAESHHFEPTLLLLSHLPVNQANAIVSGG